MQNHSRHCQRGVSLILTIGVLFVLATMAVSYSRISTYEYVASGNFLVQTDAKLAALAGLEAAKVAIFREFRQFGYIRPTSGLLYPGASNEDLLLACRDQDTISMHQMDIAGSTEQYAPVTTGGRSYSGAIGWFAPRASGRYQNGGTPYDIYGRYEQDGTFYSLKIEQMSGRLNVNSHVSAGNQSNADLILGRILFQLAKLYGASDGQAATFVNALVRASADWAVAGQRRFHSQYEIIETVENLGFGDTLTRQLLGNLCSDTWIDDTTSGVSNPGRSATQPPIYYRERRAAIDVNNASEELLQALIMQLKATVVIFTGSAITASDPDFSGSHFNTETSMSTNITTQEIDFSDATKAASIVTALKSAFIVDQGQLAQVIEGLADGVLPTNGGGVNGSVWREACISALQSNFNPNVVDNHWNPNQSVYLRVCRGDLYATDPITSTKTPYHTNHLTCCGGGLTEITSIGWVTAQQGNLVSRKAVRAELDFYDVMQHTTQQDFTGGTPGGSNTTTYPFNMSWSSASADVWAGRVEPEPQENAYGSGTQLFPGNYFTDDIPQDTNSAKVTNIGVAQMAATATIAGGFRTTNLNNLANDGIVSVTTQYGSSAPNYFVGQAYGGDITRGNNSGANVANYQGTIEFWTKLAVDGDASIGCGLIGVTLRSAIRTGIPDTLRTPPINTNFHEGISMYMYKNTLGKLRVSRIYYAFCYDASGNPYGAVFNEDADGDRKIPRRDAVVDISDWEAHTWHHVMVSWDDEQATVGNSLRIWVDGIERSTPSPEDLNTAEHPEYCILNEKTPMDVFFINGFYRNQRDQSGGFLFSQVVNYPGNATMDGIISYDQAYSGSAPSVSRFPTGTASYSNVFTIDATYALGPLRWISHPSRRTGGVNYLTCSATTGGSASHDYPASALSPGYYGDGIPSSISNVNAGDQVTYTTSFTTAGHSTLGSTCAALDSVQLVLLYSQPQVISFRYLQ